MIKEAKEHINFNIKARVVESFYCADVDQIFERDDVLDYWFTKEDGEHFIFCPAKGYGIWVQPLLVEVWCPYG